MSVKQREQFLDRLRVAATCAVVLLHTITGVMDMVDMSVYPLEKRVFLVALDLICWCVPVFIMISGYLFLNPARKIGFRDIVMKYCRRILLALFLFGVPYACLEQIALEKNFHMGMIGEGFLMVLRGESWSHMWYLYLIFFLYLMTPALGWLLPRLPRPVIYALLIVLFAGSSVIPYLKKLFHTETVAALPDGCIYLFYYICGYLFAVKGRERQDKEQANAGMRKVFSAGIAALALALALSRLIGDYTVQMAYNYPFTVLLALLLFARGQSSEPESGREKAAFWKKAAELSFAVYLIHPVFLNTAYKFLHITPLDFTIGVSLPVFFVSALALAALGAWILRKIPPLKKYVL